MRRLRCWPFAELKRGVVHLLSRIVLVQLAILGGMPISAFSSRPRAFFGAFGVLKTLSDVSCLFPRDRPPPAEAPRWFLRLADRLGGKHWKAGRDDARWWRETTLAERRRAEEDEQIIEPTSRTRT